MSDSRTTTDRNVIRNWAEKRGGRPAKVETSGEGGILRIDFDGPEERLTEISWDEFFEIFEKNKLAFLYQEKTADGSTSRFNKLVDRTGA